MGVISVLKNALSAVGDFDQRMAYGPKYKEKMAVLSRLNEIEMRGKLLENDDKFARIQQMRQAMAMQERQQKAAAFQAAQQFGAAQDSTVDPTFVGPRLDEANLPNPTEEGFTQPTLPAFLAEGVDPQDQGALQAATIQARGQRRQGEERASQLFQAKVSADKALAEDRLASARFDDRRPAAGAGGGTGGGRLGPDYYTTVKMVDENGVEFFQRMRSSEAAELGKIRAPGAKASEEIRSLTNDIAMTESLVDRFKPEYADRVKNTIQSARENAPDLGMNIIDSPDPDFTAWRADVARLNNVVIRALSGAQVTPSEFPRITMQMPVTQLNPVAWKARALAQAKAMRVARDIRLGNIGIEEGRARLAAIDQEAGAATAAPQRGPGPGGAAPKKRIQFDANGNMVGGQ